MNHFLFFLFLSFCLFFDSVSGSEEIFPEEEVRAEQRMYFDQTSDATDCSIEAEKPSVVDAVRSYLEREVEENSCTREERLRACKKPLVIGDNAKLGLQGMIETYRRFKSFSWFGLYQDPPILDWQDNQLHYLVGHVNKDVYSQTKVSCINYLLLAFDAAVVFQNNDEYGHHYVKRITRPILFDRAAGGKYTLVPTKDTEHVVFLSYPHSRKKEHKKIVDLSSTNCFNVTDLHKKPHKVYFYPEKITKENDNFEYMSGRFPSLGDNFDAEVHAVHAFLNNQHLVDEFVNEVKNDQGLAFFSIGLRYYSFLDMCGRC